MTAHQHHTTDPDVSHGLLLALLNAAGGEAVISETDYTSGCTTASGAWLQVAVEPLTETGQVRLRIIQQPTAE